MLQDEQDLLEFMKADLLKARSEHNITRYYHDLDECKIISEKIQWINDQLKNMTGTPIYSES